MNIKKIYLLLIIACTFFAQNAWGQSTLSKWALTSNDSPNSVAANVSAGNYTGGTGISSITYGVSGAYAEGWTTSTTPDANDYFQITVAPSSGYELEIQEILFGERRSGTGIREYQVQW